MCVCVCALVYSVILYIYFGICFTSKNAFNYNSLRKNIVCRCGVSFSLVHCSTDDCSTNLPCKHIKTFEMLLSKTLIQLFPCQSMMKL